MQNALSYILLSKNLKFKIYRNIILSVLCGCETWSLTLREEHRLRVLERVLGPSRDKVTGECRKLQNKEFKELYCSPNITHVITFRRTGWSM